MTMLSLCHRTNTCVRFRTRTFNRIIVLFALFASIRCALSAQEPAAVIQERIKSEVHLIKVAIDQHRPEESIGYLWATLGADYRKSGDFSNSEAAYLHAVELFEASLSSMRNYATTLDNLGMLYLTYGRVDDAERYNRKAAAIRNKMNYPIDLAWSTQHMAEINLAKHKYKEAENGAAEALAAMEAHNDPEQLDRISALNALAYTRCLRRRCEQGMGDARRSLDIARNNFGAESVPSAHALMALGFALWKLERFEDADRTLRAGVEMMRAKAGPRSRALLLALAEYRDFLKGTHRDEAAESVTKQLAEAKSLSIVCATCVTVNSLRNTTK